MVGTCSEKTRPDLSSRSYAQYPQSYPQTSFVLGPKNFKSKRTGDCIILDIWDPPRGGVGVGLVLACVVHCRAGACACAGCCGVRGRCPGRWSVVGLSPQVRQPRQHVIGPLGFGSGRWSLTPRGVRRSHTQFPGAVRVGRSVQRSRGAGWGALGWVSPHRGLSFFSPHSGR